MLHLDLFSGIGGFAYAADQVWPGIEHVFCDNEPFAQAVLKKHWPESDIYDDIRSITTDTDFVRRVHGQAGKQSTEQHHETQREPEPGAEPPFLLTGGFPCQPYSNAGLRRGTADERHLWPEMLRVIRLTEPRWVIAENVSGLLTWNEGLVFEQVCLDLEEAGYEVQPFVIPAVALNAPHRRDRVWFLAKNTCSERHGGRRDGNTARNGRQNKATRPDWERAWPEVAAELCGVAYGFSARLDGRMTPSKHWAHRTKALGNAIVPQVAIQIMQAIKLTEETGVEV